MCTSVLRSSGPAGKTEIEPVPFCRRPLPLAVPGTVAKPRSPRTGRLEYGYEATATVESEMQGAEQKRQWGEKVRAMTDEELAAARRALAEAIESCRANPAQRKEYVELSEVIAREQEGREVPGSPDERKP